MQFILSKNIECLQITTQLVGNEITSYPPKSESLWHCVLPEDDGDEHDENMTAEASIITCGECEHSGQREPDARQPAF